MKVMPIFPRRRLNKDSFNASAAIGNVEARATFRRRAALGSATIDHPRERRARSYTRPGI